MLLVATTDPPKDRGDTSLTFDQVLAIFDRRGENQSKLAEEFGVSRVLVNKIQNRKAWAWLTTWQRPIPSNNGVSK
jgi:hypothetical protein